MTGRTEAVATRNPTTKTQMSSQGKIREKGSEKILVSVTRTRETLTRVSVSEEVAREVREEVHMAINLAEITKEASIERIEKRMTMTAASRAREEAEEEAEVAPSGEDLSEEALIGSIEKKERTGST